jgi:hypothetical protein
MWICVLAVIFITSCGQRTLTRSTLRRVGPEKLRAETIEVCRGAFRESSSQKIAHSQWPESVRLFKPLDLWAEPDGAYLLLDSDADGERGIYLPRIVSDKDPVCSPVLKHEKLAEGVYWYERKR